MRKRKLKKGLAWILACALFMGMTPVNTQAKEQKNSEIVLLTANVASGGSAPWSGRRWSSSSVRNRPFCRSPLHPSICPSGGQV